MRWDNCSDVSYKAYTHAIDMDAQLIWNGEYFLPAMSPAEERVMVEHLLEGVFVNASVDWWIHMRYLKGDNEVIASPCYGWDACIGIELALVASAMDSPLPPKHEWLAYFLPFERFMLNRGARPHHAKYHTAGESFIPQQFWDICELFDKRQLLV